MGGQVGWRRRSLGGSHHVLQRTLEPWRASALEVGVGGSRLQPPASCWGQPAGLRPVCSLNAPGCLIPPFLLLHTLPPRWPGSRLGSLTCLCLACKVRK